jgi:serralysin
MALDLPQAILGLPGNSYFLRFRKKSFQDPKTGEYVVGIHLPARVTAERRQRFLAEVARIDQLIDLDFYVDPPGFVTGEDIFIYQKSDPADFQGSPGYATYSEIFLNLDLLTNDKQYGNTLLHELGHVIGLNHPWEDGGPGGEAITIDDINRFSDEQTIMAYRSVVDDEESFRDADIQALLLIWGAENGNGPTYSIRPSALAVNEGEVVKFVVETSGVPVGTTMYWGLAGSGITKGDLAAGDLSGQANLEANGQLEFSCILSNDSATGADGQNPSEGDEILEVRLYSDAARTAQLGSTVNITIRNYQAGPTTIRGLNLGSTSLGYAINDGIRAPIQITYSGEYASASNPGSGWSAIGVTTSGNGYELYWKNSNSAQYGRWFLDSNGALISGVALSLADLLTAETSLAYDLNTDGSTGLTYSAGGATINGVNLGSTALGYALKVGAAAPLQITYSGQYASAGNPGDGWSAIAAASAVGGGYQLYWKNAGSSQYARWNLGVDGSLIDGGLLSTADLLAAETSLAYDINKDGSTGLTYSTGGATINGVNLGSTALGYALKAGAAAPLHITYSGQYASASNPGSGWSAIAVAAAGNGYELYWKNSNSAQFARWTLGSNGDLISGMVLSLADLLAGETSLGYDLNTDGSTGLTFSAGGVTLNGVNLGSTALGYALKAGAASPVQITYSGQYASAENPGGGWSAIAAAPTAGGGYQLYWKNTGSSQYARWNLDGDGSLIDGRLLSTDDRLAAETSLAYDLNTDGSTGLSYSAGGVTLNGVNLGSTTLGYALKAGSAAPLHISYSGQYASAGNPGDGWSAIAAASGVDGGYQLYWKNTGSSQYARWKLDGDGSLIDGSLLTLPALYAEESGLSTDLDQDGITGLPYTKGFVTLSGVNLGTWAQGYGFQVGATPAIHVSFEGQFASDSNPGGSWRAIAAAPSALGVDLYWRNSVTQACAQWILASDGSLLSGKVLAGAEVLAAEMDLAFDLSSNGVIGG